MSDKNKTVVSLVINIVGNDIQDVLNMISVSASCSPYRVVAKPSTSSASSSIEWIVTAIFADPAMAVLFQNYQLLIVCELLAPPDVAPFNPLKIQHSILVENALIWNGSAEINQDVLPDIDYAYNILIIPIDPEAYTPPLKHIINIDPLVVISG